MLTSLRIENFKSIGVETKIDLAPLTVFAGANSSGKSTVLQTLLLAHQTLVNPYLSRPIVLNGKVFRFGGMKDLVNQSTSDGSISIGFDFSLERPSHWPERLEDHSYLFDFIEEKLQRASISFTFKAENNAPSAEHADLQPIITRSILTWKNLEQEPISIALSRAEKSALEKAQDLNLSFQSLSKQERASLDFNIEEIGDIGSIIPKYFLYGVAAFQEGPVVTASLDHFIPSAIFFRYDKVHAQASSTISSILGDFSIGGVSKDSLPQALVEKLIGAAREAVSSIDEKDPHRAHVESVIKNIQQSLSIESAANLVRAGGVNLRALLQSDKATLTEIAKAEQPPQFLLGALPVPVSNYIRFSLVERLRYLGPLRDEPKQFYPLEETADPTYVGLRGEFTAAVLTANGDGMIQYVSSKDWAEQGPSAKITEATLTNAVLDWLQFMGVVTGLSSSDKGVSGHELRVSMDLAGEKSHSLVHVGVGVSQVLPVLVMALIAKPETILIFEQPELHLHPKIQARLGDFLLSVSLSGRQCLVETHSEYLINRLRLKAAKDESDSVSQNIALYYVAKEDKQASYVRVFVNEYGAIADWPEGFFDQSPREVEDIIRAATRKRQKRKAQQ